jgi:hypothetical protein
MRVNFTKDEVNNILKDMLASGELELDWNGDVKEFRLESFNMGSKVVRSGIDVPPYSGYCYHANSFRVQDDLLPALVQCIVSYRAQGDLNFKTVIIGSDKLIQIIRDRKLEGIGI